MIYPSSPLLSRIFWLSAALLLPLNLLGSSQHIFYLTNGLASAEVPFQLLENFIVVEAYVAGKKPLNFILDNGTGNPVIFSPKYIKELSLEWGPQINFRGAGTGKAVRSTVVSGTSLHLSGVATDQLGMVVLEKNPFGHLKLGDLEIHGVLGSTLFRSFIVEIDYPNQILRFHRYDRFCPPPSFHSMPMKVVDFKPYLWASVQGDKISREAYLMLDLGFNNSILLQLPDDQARDMLTHRMISKIGMGYSGTVAGRSGQLAAVQIGNHFLTQVPALAPSRKSYPTVLVSPGVPRLGNVGNAFFRNTTIILNYPDERFYVRGPNSVIADFQEDSSAPELNFTDQDQLIF